MDELKSIIECLLFVTDEPLTVDRLKSVLPSTDGKDIRQALGDLAEEYEARRGGFYLKEVAGGYQLRTRPEHRQWVQELVKPTPFRLSRAALETLAIIAYKQPIIRADIEHIRGVDSGGVLRMLLEKKLVRVLGRKDIPGRPMIYATTKRFLELFDLKDLKDLPTPKEIEALGIPDEPTAHEQAELPLQAPEDQNSAIDSEDDAVKTSETDTANKHMIDRDSGVNATASPEEMPVDEKPAPGDTNTQDSLRGKTPEGDAAETPLPKAFGTEVAGTDKASPDNLSVSGAEPGTETSEDADTLQVQTRIGETAFSPDVINGQSRDLKGPQIKNELDRDTHPENAPTENDLVSESLPSNEENAAENEFTPALQPYISVKTSNAKVEPGSEENEEKKDLT